MTAANADMKQTSAAVLAHLRNDLLGELAASGGHWEGGLSSSALATAVAVFALAQVDPGAHAATIEHGVNWLLQNRNGDGGWGDSPDSPSNLSTTLLCWSALALGNGSACEEAVQDCGRWLSDSAGGLEPDRLAAAVLAFYGDDRTFSAPILTMCALAGRLGPTPDAWRFVPQLPFELAVLPHQLYRSLRLPVVSYAIPALIGIGLVRHRCGPLPILPFGRLLRTAATPRSLRVLAAAQPDSGGFLEATPLTAFVTMSLAGCGLRNCPVVDRGVAFLLESVREDGSWPIDTNLATWVTTLAVNAGAADALDRGERERLRDWLLAQQHVVEHPFTHAAPGGWAWTDLSGGVPDADDTAGALLALRRLGPIGDVANTAAAAGLRWLLDLQNGDGGIPTFCRGWGRLPFDRSCPDITAHALRAFTAWRHDVPELSQRLDTAVARGLRYLASVQSPDGAWVPLWFGNSAAPRAENPVYGTAQVVLSLAEVTETPSGAGGAGDMVRRGRDWLRSSQHADGGWGGDAGVPPSIEETSVAVAALAGGSAEDCAAAERGAEWLLKRTEGGRRMAAAPIGLYFASLWYSERLYPRVFALAALQKVVDSCQSQ